MSLPTSKTIPDLSHFRDEESLWFPSSDVSSDPIAALRFNVQSFDIKKMQEVENSSCSLGLKSIAFDPDLL